MATLYAQQALTWNGSSWSVANKWNTAANGSGSNQDPASGDTLEANSYTITISGSLNLGATGRLNAVGGGGFTSAANGITLTANIGLESATSTGTSVFAYTAASPNSMTIVGDVVGGASGNKYGISFASSGTVYVVCNNALTGGFGVKGGIASSSQGINFSSGNLVITGKVGGSATASGAAGISASSGTITVTGTVEGSEFVNAVTLSNSAALDATTLKGGPFGSGNSSGGKVPTVAVSNTGTGACTALYLEFGALGCAPVSGPFAFTASVLNTVTAPKTGGGTKTLIDSNNSASYPSAANVRYDISYGSGQKGTCYVPAASSVASGVLVDNTVGTAVITPAGLLSALGLASGNLDTQLSGISAKTANLPASPAAVGSAMTLTSAYDAAKTAAPTAVAVATQVRAELGVELGRIDAPISSRYAGTPPSAAAVASQVRTELSVELGRISNCATVDSTGAQLAALM